MGDDLHLTGFRFNIAAAVFFVRIFYLVLRVSPGAVQSPDTILPSRSAFVCFSLPRLTFPTETIGRNLLLRVFRPSRWRPYSSAFSLHHSVSNFIYPSPFSHASLGYSHIPDVLGQELPGPRRVSNLRYSPVFSLNLGSVRTVLGLTEGGLFPGLAYYVSMWYPRQMQAKRLSLFTSCASIAGAFSGLLAYGIERLDGYGTRRSSESLPCADPTCVGRAGFVDGNGS